MDLQLVHLVRAANGLTPFRRFVSSYLRHDAGAPHSLHIVFKGFEESSQRREYLEVVDGLGATYEYVSDSGFDLSVYFGVAEVGAASHYCFVNSFSAVRTPGWLGSLAGALGQPDAGLVGATGSWGSVRSYLRFDLGLRGPYQRAFGSRRVAREQFRVHNSAQPQDVRSSRSHITRMLRTAMDVPGQALRFEGFPAPHVRTNVFLIQGELMRSLDRGPLHRKIHAYALESGRRSITNQVRALGLRPLIVGRDGRTFDIDAWPDSNVFWIGEQKNLLVADNQTEDYEAGDRQWRLLLSRYAWGCPGG